MQRWRASGEIAAKRRGGSTSPLEDHAAAMLALAGEQPDGRISRWRREEAA